MIPWKKQIRKKEWCKATALIKELWMWHPHEGMSLFFTMEFINLLKDIDFDFWSSAKRDIVFLLKETGDIDSISELARAINRSFSVTHRHVVDLHHAKILIYRKITAGNKMMVSLRDPHSSLAEIMQKPIQKL